MSAMSAAPFCSVAIPCLDEARHIERCVRTALAQDYPAERLEVLVADGGSRDGTRERLARMAARERRLTVIDNPQRIQATAMNAMIRAARGEVIVRMDAHCRYPRDYVRRCVTILEQTGADNAGGAQRLVAHGAFQHALADALSSPLGMGGAAYRDKQREGWVDTVYLGAFRRRAFERAGLYDPGAVTNEDAELNQRIVASGGRVWLSRDIVVHYHPRASWRTLFTQYFRYGRGRARTLLKHRTLPSPRSLAPFAAVALGTTLLLGGNPLVIPALAGYAALTAAEAARVGAHGGLGRIARVWATFPVLHAAHGAGFAAGLWRYLREPDWSEPERLAPRSAPTTAGAGSLPPRG